MKGNKVVWLVTPLIVGSAVLRVLLVASAGAAEKPSSPPANSTTIPPLIEGIIAALDLKASPPSVTLTAQDGKRWVLPLDPAFTAVWRNWEIEPVKLEQLKVGETIKVHYGKKDGKSLITSLLILEEPPPLATIPRASLPPPANPATQPSNTTTAPPGAPRESTAHENATTR